MSVFFCDGIAVLLIQPEHSTTYWGEALTPCHMKIAAKDSGRRPAGGCPAASIAVGAA
jgi:hypothetical protein